MANQSRQLKKLKRDKDNYSNNYIFNLIKLIKSEFGIAGNERVYFLGYYNTFNYFLYHNQIFVTAWDCQRDNKNNFLTETMFLTCLYKVTLLKNYPKRKKDIEFEIIKDSNDLKYKAKDFLEWIDEPSQITVSVDLPYYKVIEFLQNYNYKTFKFGDFIFYPKRDKDLTYTLNFYAKELKTNTEIKLYIPEKYEILDNEDKIYLIPQNLKDIIIGDASGDLSSYRKRQFKIAFLEFAQETCRELGVNNFFALELIKQTIQPVEYNPGWCVHRIFCKPDKFAGIWVEDFPLKGVEPYFLIADKPFSWNMTKIAVLNFKSATYHIQGIYKQGLWKRKGWLLDKAFIDEFITFLNAPVKGIDYRNGTYKKYVKTNWQHLIYEYNYNTAGCDFSQNANEQDKRNDYYDGIEVLPFDLPIPDYTKLLKEGDF